MNILRTAAPLVLVLGIAAGCTTAGAAPTATPAPASQAPAAASQTPAAAMSPATVTLNTATAAGLGAYLIGPNGLTLYTKTGDTATSSTCTGGCATAWPPLTVPAGGQAVAGTGVTGKLGTLVRADGTTQVTYAGAAVRIYWIVDVNRNRLEVHTDPTGSGPEARYATTQVLGPDDEVGLILDDREVARFAVREILP